MELAAAAGDDSDDANGPPAQAVQTPSQVSLLAQRYGNVNARSGAADSNVLQWVDHGFEPAGTDGESGYTNAFATGSGAEPDDAANDCRLCGITVSLRSGTGRGIVSRAACNLPPALSLSPSRCLPCLHGISADAELVEAVARVQIACVSLPAPHENRPESILSLHGGQRALPAPVGAQLSFQRCQTQDRNMFSVAASLVRK